MKKARLLNKYIVKRFSGDVVLDGRTALTFLHIDKVGTYWFCVNKLHGTGASGIGLKETEFKWL